MAALLLGAALAGCSDGDGEDAAAAWQVLPQSPLAGRFSTVEAWTGTEMIIWGGGSCSGDLCNNGIATPLGDGAAYDPAANRWRTIAPSPLRPRLRAMSAWTGSELLVWGGNALLEPLADGAAYDPATDRWRLLPPSPLSARFGAAATWTGRELLIWGGGEGGQTASRVFADGAAYEPAADRWRPMAGSPLTGRTVGQPGWTGREMIVWGGSSGEASLADGAAYEPAADRWRPLAPSPLAARAGPSSAWTGKELLLWGSGTSQESFNDGAAYDPAGDRWRPLPESPLQPRRAFAHAWTGAELLIWGGGPDNSLVFYGSGAAYDPAADEWRELPGWNARFGPAAVWTGQELIVWGGIYAPAKIEVLGDGARLRLRSTG